MKITNVVISDYLYNGECTLNTKPFVTVYTVDNGTEECFTFYGKETLATCQSKEPIVPSRIIDKDNPKNAKFLEVLGGYLDEIDVVWVSGMRSHHIKMLYEFSTMLDGLRTK